MSITILHTACYNEEFEGVQPNIKYTPTILELTSEMDTHLLFAQRVIKEIRRKEKSEMN